MKNLTRFLFRAQRRWRCLAGVALALGGTVASAAQEVRVLDAAFLDALRLEVRTNHPTVAAAQARVQAARSSVRAVRLWEDPMIGAGVMTAEREMRAGDGDVMLMAEQVLPRPKLYRARKARAEAERSILEAETHSAVLTLETLVAQTAIELALLNEMLTIQTNQLAWLESMAANARERLKDPAATASEPLRLESEVAQERQIIDTEMRNRVRLIRQLNILLGRSPDDQWPDLRLPESAALLGDLPGRLNDVFRVNPMLQALLNSARAAELDIEVARRERSPVFSVGVESGIYSRGEFRQATVVGKMSLPLFNRSIYRANIQRAEQERIAAEREVEALERRLRGEAIAAYTDAENAAQQVATFSKEVIPRAEKAAETTQNAWTIGKANLLEVLESRRVMLNARLEERRFAAAYRAALETLRSILPPQSQP